MRLGIVSSLFLLLVACGAGGGEGLAPKGPVSIRGWVEDVEASIPPAGTTRTLETEIARRSGLFLGTTLWVENATSVSGGFAQNGSFILLDVPPGSVSIGFAAPGADHAQIHLQDVPPNADVLLPRLLVMKGAKVSVMDPTRLAVRLASRVDKPRPTGKFAVIAGHRVPIIEVPYSAMEDRREYPNPGGISPLATYK